MINKGPVMQTNQAARGVPLSSLPVGSTGTVLAIRLNSVIIGQLMGMGLFAGSTISILQKGLTDNKPILISVGDTRIAMGHEYADLIYAEPNHPD